MCVQVAWKTGTKGSLPLNDDDSTTVIDNGWRRINTLRHYNVKDNASFIIEIRQPANDSTTHDIDDATVQTVNGQLAILVVCQSVIKVR